MLLAAFFASSYILRSTSSAAGLPRFGKTFRLDSAFDAVQIVDKALDNAMLAGVGKITIIHGKGTGVLRREINQFLRTNKNVKSHRLGTFGEGEDGVTIVELK